PKFSCRSSFLLRKDEGDAGGKTVEEVPVADRADLAVTEEAGDGERAEQLLDGVSIVVRSAEEADAATVTGAQEGADRLLVAELGFGAGEHLMQLLIGG